MKKALEFLTRVNEKNRLSHLYIFSGDIGTGKKALAIEFAKLILRPYDQSLNFDENVNNLVHSQIHYIAPDGATIKKQQILDLQEEFTKTSLVKGPRIYIIEDVDLISTSAANSLLKFMEEPENKATYGILLTSNLTNVLPTIISRAQNIKLTTLNKADFIQKLVDNDIEIKLARNIVFITNSLDKALELASDESFLKIVSFLEEILEKWDDKTFSITLKIYEELTEILYEKEYYQIFLELLLIYILDIIRYKTHQELAMEHLKVSIQNMSHSMEVKTLELITRTIQDEIAKITYYINIGLSLDALVLLLEKSR